MSEFVSHFAGITAQALSPRAAWIEDWARLMMSNDKADFNLSRLEQDCYSYQPDPDYRSQFNRHVAVKWLMEGAIDHVYQCCSQTILSPAIDSTLSSLERAEKVLANIEAFYRTPPPIALLGFLTPHVADFVNWEDPSIFASSIDASIDEYLDLWCTTLESVLEPLVGPGRSYNLAQHTLAVLYGARCLQWTGASPNAVSHACAYLRQGWFSSRRIDDEYAV